MHRGFVKIWRCIDDWAWSCDPIVLGVFVRMVMMANWKDKQWQGITVKRGQFVSSRHKLAELFGLSDQQMRTVLFKLKSTGEATSTSTSKYTLYTIENYDKFQNDAHAINQQSNQQSNQPSTTTKEVKNKEVKKTKRTTPQDSRITLIKNYFASRYMQHTNAAYLSAHARDGALIKSSLEAYDKALTPPTPGYGAAPPLSHASGAVAHFTGLIDRFFAPEHLYKGNCDIPSFFKAMNRLQQQPHSGTDSTLVDMSIFERNEP